MQRSEKIVRISLLGIAVNLILVVMKASIGFFSGSIAVMMDAVNNLSDALSSVITIVGTKLAGLKPDKKHPYGYGRIEYLSSVTIAVIVLLAGFASFKESLDKVFHPVDTHYNYVSMLMIAVAVLMKAFLGTYVKKAGKKYHSDALVASGTDAFFDAVISFSTLVAAIVSYLFPIRIEGYLGVVISVVIVRAGVEILLDSLGSIIGSRIDSEFSTKLKEKITQYPEVLGAYDLVVHRYGPEKMIGSVHIELPDMMNAREIHVLTRRIAEDVYRTEGLILTVGVYASNTINPEFVRMKETLHEIIARDSDILQMHAFYVDTERMIVSFDLVLDFQSKRKGDIPREIEEAMRKVYPAYEFVAIPDSDFSD